MYEESRVELMQFEMEGTFKKVKIQSVVIRNNNIIKEAFSYSDNGISLNINLAQGYQSMAQMLLNGYVQGKTNIKRAMRPKAASLASGAGGNTNVRVRSYAPRMWVYR